MAVQLDFFNERLGFGHGILPLAIVPNRSSDPEKVRDCLRKTAGVHL
jgi:hypothetical protein